MRTKGTLSWAFFLNLGVPLTLLAFAYGCGGVAFIGGEALHAASTALEGRAVAARLAQRWDAQASLVGVEGVRVRRDGRLAEKSDSLWIYRFSRPTDGAFYEVRRDGRGTVDAGPRMSWGTQGIWQEGLEGWRVDSPAVAAEVTRARLPVVAEFGMQLMQDGVWRVSAEDGRYLWELQIDARTGRRIL